MTTKREELVMKQLRYDIHEVRNNGIVQTWSIADGEHIIVGRSHKNANFVLADPAVSRTHLRIECINHALYVENLSLQKAELAGLPIKGRVEIKVGQCLRLGSSSALQFQLHGDPSGRLPAAQGKGPNLSTDAKTTGRDTPSTETLLSPQTLTRDQPGMITSRIQLDPSHASNKINETMTSSSDQGTSMATQAEQTSGTNFPEMRLDGYEGTIELGTMIQPQRRKPVTQTANYAGKIVVLILVLLSLAMMAFLLRRPKPPRALTWPVDIQGNYLEATVKSPRGHFDIVYPLTKDVDCQQVGSDIIIKYSIDQVPFVMTCSEMPLGDCTLSSTPEVVLMWKSLLPESENFVFESSLDIPVFIGSEQGVPMTVIPYFRAEAKGKYRGVVHMVRYGEELLALRIEIPERYQLFAEEILLNYYIAIDIQEERRHWQGYGDAMDKDTAAQLLVAVKKEMTRDAPDMWDQTENLLIATICRSYLEKNQDVFHESIDLLENVRIKKSNWYNAQTLVRATLLRRDERENLQRIKQQCQLVFSSPRDQRFYTVRSWK